MQPSATHVQAVYDDSYFCGGKAGYPDYLAEGELLRRRGRWYGGLLARLTKPGRVLDVGTAAGFILRGLQECGWTGTGLEPNARMADYGRTRLGLTIDTTTLEEFHSTERYDLVSMIQVVAHLTDARKAFAACSAMTAPGAFLLVESWNRRSWTARLFGQSWHEYSPPSVLRWFSPSDLEKLLEQFGFRKIASGRPPKRILGAHAKALLEYKAREWRRFGGVFRAVTRMIPDNAEIWYPGEDLFWMILQKPPSPDSCGASSLTTAPGDH